MLLTGELISLEILLTLKINFSYGVSSIIGLDESEPTNLFEVPVPPRFDNSNHLVIEKKVNDSVTFSISNNDKNQRCKVR